MQYLNKIIIFFICSCCYSQTQLSLSFSQTAVDDWKQGKRQTFEISSSLDSKLNFKIDTLCIQINLKYDIGLLLDKSEKNEKDHLMPTDNNLFGEIVLKYPLNWQIDPYISSSVRTQITESFRLSKDQLVRTANFWDPVTSQQAIGFSYKNKLNTDFVNFRLGISTKQIRALYHTQMTDDRTTKDIQERYKEESGIELKTNTFIVIDSSTTYKGSFDAFGTFEDMTKWTIEFDSEFQIKIWKWFGIIAKIKVFYDESKSLNTQYNQSLSLGLVGRF
jgi:hypothetical protein